MVCGMLFSVSQLLISLFMGLFANAYANTNFCGVTLPENVILCPRISELNYDKRSLLWSTDSGWRSTQNSTSSTLKRFVGAQWNGWATGQITCVYEPESSDSFPINVTTSVAAKTPQIRESTAEGIWRYTNWQKSSNTQNNRFRSTFNCPSTDGSVCNCPVEIFIQKTLSTREIIESIRRDPFNESVFTSTF